MTEIMRFGMVADLQYADIDDGYNFSKTRKRYYRNAISLLQEAMNNWKKHNIEFVLQLGDIIDGFCKRNEEPVVCIDRILDLFDQETWPVYHIVGNHELYNLSKEEIYSSRLFKTLPATNKAYYSIEPHPGIKICALNTYEISTLGSVEGTPEYNQAFEFLKKNPNEDKNNLDGLVSVNKRFGQFNGAVSQQQIEWLKKELGSSEQQNQNVIVIGHIPIFLDATDDVCLCWNYEDVFEAISEFESCVVCYIGGHNHDGGLAVDDNGIHHITMHGAIEHPDTYAIGYLYEDYIRIEGIGDMFSMTIPLRFPIS